ncbi:MAG: RNA 3'-terminal phosphate cyclase [bacterium]|jgi:RNA 3'-terminal phosphate cyclase (ATP)|nr:RNA 3'-terminal phosphate cyclase [candidate division KSB1 bacterium]MDH7559706.1 RNA 3'-terminal phosphate cyclase [bacterium]
MLVLDGSMGEGGGQVLRSALTLSLLTGKSFEIQNIRARRPKPGLVAQHLKAIEAAVAVGQAQVQGAALGSTTLRFAPGVLRPGTYRIDIGTAGSTSLVAQTVAVPLARCAARSVLTITGGTHVPWSPCFHFLQLHWLPLLSQAGFRISMELERGGFYPEGGGLVRMVVEPAGPVRPLGRTERGELRKVTGVSAVARPDKSIAERQRRQALRRLAAIGIHAEIELLSLPAPSPGTFLLLLASFAQSQCCYYALGERGKPAERVADEAVSQLERFLATDAAVDEYVADQLVIPLLLAEGLSELRVARLSRHLLTNIEVVRSFLPVVIEVAGQEGEPGSVRIHGRALG